MDPVHLMGELSDEHRLRVETAQDNKGRLLD